LRVVARTAHGPLECGSDGAWSTSEGAEVLIDVEASDPCEARLSGARLAPMEVRRSGLSIVTTWMIPIHTWAGRAEVEITSGPAHASLLLDVAPHRNKLGLAAFREMLAELVMVCKDLPWGFSPGAWSGERSATSPAVVHPTLLEHELPVLLKTLRQIRNDPLTSTLRTRAIGRLGHARGVDAASLRWLAVHPSSFVEVTSGQPRPEEVVVDQRHTYRSIQHPATAHIRFLLERLRRLLRASADQLKVAHTSNAEDEHHARWLSARIQRAHDELVRELSLPPLSLVKPAPATEGAAQAVVDHPVYARVQRLTRRLLDPGLRISETGALRATTRRTHELFELLVLYRLIDRVREMLGPEWAWSLPAVTRRGALDVLPDDAAFVAQGSNDSRVEVRYQSTFHAYCEASSLRHALSGERRPDIIVGLFRGASLRRWIVVDAKYRASRGPIHDGLADAHVYRDALRWHGAPPAASFIVVPACGEDARIYTRTEYLKQHRFGAIVTSDPDCWLTPLEAVLAS